MMFEFDETDLRKLEKDIQEDMSVNLIEKYIRAELDRAGKDYSKMYNEFEYDETEGGVITNNPQLGVLNQGREPGTYPNIDRLREWVRTVKDNGENADLPDYKINQIAYRVSKKIYDDGINPDWFIDRALAKMTGDQGASPLE